MAWTPATLIQTTGTNGDTTLPAVDMDAVDKAFINLSSTLIGFARARLVSGAPNAAFVDDCQNPVTVSGGTKSATTINGLPAISNPGTGTTLGTGASYQVNLQMPASFTFLAVVNPTALKDGNHLFTDSASGFEFSCNVSGTAGLVIDADGAGSGDGTHSTGITLTAGTPALVGCSFDAATKTMRIMKNSPIASFSAVSSVAYPAATGAKPQPFSFYTGSPYDLNGSWAMWALFNKAYGAGGSDEADFATAVNAAKSMYGIV